MNNNNLTHRIIWIDYIKAIAIFIVILLHLSMPEPFRKVTRAFVIPLFFFLAGLFANPHQYSTWHIFFQKKHIDYSSHIYCTISLLIFTGL